MSEQKYKVKVEVSIRRKAQVGLPGDDVTVYNVKLGSALKGRGPLKGLSDEEEKKYLPEIINVVPSDNEWRKNVTNYWNNISEKIPADGLNTGKLQGRILEFTIAFNTQQQAKEFETLVNQEKKAEASKKGEVIEGVADFVLWRFAILHSKVANNFQDINKSPKILFYIYSKQNETKIAHIAFENRTKAMTLFAENLTNEKVINAVLLLFGQDLASFDTLQDKHLALEALITKEPSQFIKYVEDENLNVKAFIKRAVDAKIINKPSNTDSYYYGTNNEVTLGNSLEEAVLYLKSDQDTNKGILKAIKANLKNIE